MNRQFLVLHMLCSIVFITGCTDESSPVAVPVTSVVTNDSAYFSNDDFSFYPTDHYDSTLTAPQPTAVTTPQYPEEARRQNIEGDVWIKMLILSDGTVKRCYVLQSTNSLFNKGSLAAALQWRFRPAERNGTPAYCFVAVPFKYRFNI
jgi:TonB family protein